VVGLSMNLVLNFLKKAGLRVKAADSKNSAVRSQ